MPNQYYYGTYGTLEDSIVQAAAQSGTLPVYTGTAPVHLVRGYKDRELVNYPLLITSMAVARQLCGDSTEWETFTLCETFAAHYDNRKGNIGPMVVVNVLDPEKHRKAEAVTRELTFSSGRCQLLSSTIILDSFLIEGRMEGVDFTLGYDYDKGMVTVTALETDNPITGTVEATWNEVDPSMVSEEDVVGDETEDGVYTGIKATELVYEAYSARVVALLGAPGWSEKPAVYKALLAEAKNVSGHWGAFVVADVPLTADGEAIDTRQKANAWAKANGYTSEWSRVNWPQAQDGDGRVFHLSTLAVVEYMRADASHGGVPMETCGNLPIPVVRQYFGKDSTSRGFNQQKGNYLTCRGICTAVYWNGQWVLWGDCTAAYIFPDPDDPEINDVQQGDPRGNFDTNMRMLLYLINDFQREWGSEIGKAMTLQLQRRIMTREQEKLDALVAMGALIGSPRIQFLASENSTETMMQGHFVWSLAATPTPPLRSAGIKVHYTDEGFAVYSIEEVAA